MSFLLHINTALDGAYIAISDGEILLGSMENRVQKEHASFLQPAIKSILQDRGLEWKDLAAVSVVNGPGSYTGLRVGLSAAKGICFALKKPLICIPTLEWMARPFLNSMTDIICPMIDARRMEVFTAKYDSSLNPISQPEAMILDENSFPELETQKIWFAGNGRNKLPARISAHPNAEFPAAEAGIREQMNMAYLLYREEKFSNLAYTEPFYLKAFYTKQNLQ